MKKIFIGENFKIFKNFGYLSLIQIFNLLFPLIIYPYVIRTVGKENYGLIVFAQSITIYFSLIVDFGFNIYGTNEVSKNRNSQSKLNYIISTIFSAQFLFYILSLIFLFLFSNLISEFNDFLLLFFASYLCLNEIMTPVWYFQGIENMKYIAICNFISKLTSLLLIFVFVRSSEDFLYILIAYFVGTFICGFFSFYKIFIQDKNTFIIPKNSDIVKLLKESSPLFVSHSLGGITSKSNSFLIGTFVGKVELAYYDLAEKIINLAAIFFQNFSNAVFPNVAKNKNFKLTRKALKITLIFSILSVIFFFLTSDVLVSILGGETMFPASEYLLILSFSLIFRAIGPIVSNAILVVNNFGKILSTSFIFGFILHVIGILFLYLFDCITTNTIIFVFLISIISRVFFRIYYCIKYGLKKWLF